MFIYQLYCFVIYITIHEYRANVHLTKLKYRKITSKYNAEVPGKYG